MSVFLTSDCHFNHDNILKYCQNSRPFKTIQEMNERIIENWNNAVSAQDSVYVLGDFFMGDNKEIPSILSRLNGTIYLVRGNHDTDSRLQIYKTCGVNYLGDYTTLRYKGVVFILNHYPLLDERFYDYILSHQRSDIIFCYGHVHDNPILLEEYKNSIFHVGVDTNNLTPVSIKEIWKKSRFSS